ncbi:MAG TPA: TauD/TfdA family dioxygenase [Acidimicrobiales bacterium]|nr:TauD/TfdA family dioxygenase [Acidimicrobiales bacterium]
MTFTIRPGLRAGEYQLHRLGPGADDKPYERFDLRPLGPTIGAEVYGVDVGQPLSPELFAELDRALLEWKVLFFRDQHVSGAQHRDFARNWGELEVHPFLREGEVPEVVRFDKGPKETGYENIWHSDVSWRLEPSLGSILRCVTPAALGGDTLWADMYMAYECLDEETKAAIEGRTAVHDFSGTFGMLLEPDKLAEMQAKYPPAEHPIVRTHPQTGRKILYVNDVFTSHVVGMEPDASRALLDHLTAQARTPEFQCRFRWEADSIAFWDNRCTQHYAVSDYAPQRRVMERATIIGDRPW